MTVRALALALGLLLTCAGQTDARPVCTVTCTPDLQGNWVGMRVPGQATWHTVGTQTPLELTFPLPGLPPSPTYDIRVEHRGWLLCWAAERTRFMPGSDGSLPQMRLQRSGVNPLGVGVLALAATALAASRWRRRGSSAQRDVVPAPSLALPPLEGRVVESENGRRCEIGALLGQGGMGAVFAVTRQGGAGEPLSESDAWAIKAPLRRIYEDPARRARLLAEARVCATIFHTGLVQVLDWGTFDGDWPFIVMERMRGRTLRQVLDQGTPPIDTALAWLRDLACTLEMLHGRGVAHRDLKPENIWVGAQGGLKVGDFGMAGKVDASETGGTFLYLAPEQLRPGATIDGAAADVFALGVIAGEMLTGTAPYDGQRGPELLRRKAAERPHALRDIDARVADLVNSMTDHDAGRRITAAQIHDCLRSDSDP